MDDLISRQAAIDGKISVQRTNGVEIYSDDVVPVKYLENLPSAQPQWIPYSESSENFEKMRPAEPQRMKGRWIKSNILESMLWKCDQCGFDCGAHSFNFCPNCGADMRGEQE